jgi:hypothetical protein
VVVDLGLDWLKVLPDNRGSRHQITKAKAWSLRDLGLSKSRCERFSQAKLNSDHSDDGQTEDNGPDSQDTASEGVCFHGPTLFFQAPRVLIERICGSIDGSDKRQKGASDRRE